MISLSLSLSSLLSNIINNFNPNNLTLTLSLCLSLSLSLISHYLTLSLSLHHQVETPKTKTLGEKVSAIVSQEKEDLDEVILTKTHLDKGIQVSRYYQQSWALEVFLNCFQ